jgi:glyoxylase-like metal-dependent hydrolase (beta-lactamase superfamily II)/8-oxo-dGTP pyrophosphatase MutT (NUDIX family)
LYVIPVPRPAATIVLLRDSDEGPVALLTKRQEGLRFMGGATVFPGGAVDQADLDPRWEEASGQSRAGAAELLVDVEPERALGFFVCAVREAFEEVGCVLTAADLVPAGRWVTPEGAPIRFDTFFFVARAPAGWEPDVDESEVAGAWWSTPARALTEQAAGNLLMAPPTVEMLQRLSRHADVGSLLRSLESQTDETGAATRLSPFVHVVVAPNPGVMTGPGTNCYIVGADPTVVIDPAVDDEDFLHSVATAAGDVAQILITHRHSDHVGGAGRLAEMTGAPVRAFGNSRAGDAVVSPLSDGDVIQVGAARLVAIHAPGHASDHLCFYLDGTTSLFSGDTVLGEGTAVIAPPDGDMRAYLESLHRLQSWRIGRIYPGHWQPLDGGRSVIDRYIAHRKEREASIEEALATSPASIDEIVARVYVDTPAHLHPIAAYSVRAHLEMLEEAGRVKRANEQWAPTGVD